MANEFRYDAKAGLWRCTWPGCDYSHADPGAVRLHYWAKHRRRPKKAATPTGQAAPDAGQADESGRCSCGGVYRVLGHTGLEAAARKDGWRLICDKCGGLSK